MEKFEKLKNQLKKLPGIGNKSAERIAFYLLTHDKEYAKDLSISINEAIENIKVCSVCGGITENDPCDICTSTKRENGLLMIVENAKDIFVFEKGIFNGKYHVLGGLISPLDNITPEDLSIEKLSNRLNKENIKEIIIALPPSTEGETTSMYLYNLYKQRNIKITKIAYGIPFGSNFDFIDEYTLSKSLENRQKIL